MRLDESRRFEYVLFEMQPPAQREAARTASVSSEQRPLGAL